MEKLAPRAGISLFPDYFPALLESRPELAFLSLSPELFLGEGGAPHHYLRQLAEHYPLVLSSHSLSIGSAESVDGEYLERLARLSEAYAPAQVSEPLAWSRWQGVCLPGRLPTPYNEESLDHACINIKQVQNALGRRLLVRNEARYFPLENQDLTEGQFFSALVRHTGCSIALDISSLYVSGHNLGVDPARILDDYPLAAVHQLAIAGHTPQSLDQDTVLLVADRSTEITKPVWQLFRDVLAQLPKPQPTIVEWQRRRPTLAKMLDVVDTANRYLLDAQNGDRS